MVIILQQQQKMNPETTANMLCSCITALHPTLLRKEAKAHPKLYYEVWPWLPL